MRDDLSEGRGSTHNGQYVALASGTTKRDAENLAGREASTSGLTGGAAANITGVHQAIGPGIATARGLEIKW